MLHWGPICHARLKFKVVNFSIEVAERGLITKGEQGSSQIFRGEMRGRREFGSESIYLLLL